MADPGQKIRVREYDEDPSRERERGNVAENYHEYILTVATASSPATPTAAVSSVTHLESNRRRRWLQAPARVVQDLFLPIGFPTSVNEGYLQYQIYDSVQGLSSYLRGVLCSAAVLEAAGVGRAEATALSAAMTWALKDGVSMIGGLIFSYTSAPLFDSHVKEFRLFADLINDVGLSLDMVAPYFQNNLLAVASAAGLCKTLCGISAGATKSSITLHFALEGNMADLNAKEATQETLVSLFGMFFGIALARQLRKLEEMGHDSELIVRMQWIIFSSLTILHVWANWKGVRILRMRTLNRERAEVALNNVLNELQVLVMEQKSSPDLAALHASIRTLPPPTKVNESLLNSTRKMLFPGRLRLSAHLTEVLECDVGTIDILKNERYVLALNAHNQVLASLLTGAKPKDQLKAFIHALCLVRCSTSFKHQSDLIGRDERRKLIRQTLECVNLVFAADDTKNTAATEGNAEPTSLMAELKREGWEAEDRLYLGFSRRRSHWTLDKTE